MIESKAGEKQGIDKAKKARKRGQGEGSIYKRKDGRWAGVINLGYQEGKLKRKTFYGETREDVRGKLVAALSDQQKGLPVITERQTVAVFLEKWLEECVKPSVRYRTYECYVLHVRRNILPALGKLPLTKLNPQHVQTLMNERLSSGLSPRSVQLMRAVLRRALGQALKWGLVARNVATLVDSPRVERPEVQFMLPDDARKFLQAIEGDRLEALFSTALAMGLRQGEALGLCWVNVDFDAKELHVRYSLQRIQGNLLLTELKTRNSRRDLPLTDLVIARLRAHRSRQLQEKLIAGSRWHDSGLVFTTTIGTALDARNVVRQYHALLEKAKLCRYRFHELRHSCASLLLAQGVPLKTISDILGHSQISITADYYAHIAPETRREALSMMDTLFSAAK
jgi:integrase